MPSFRYQARNDEGIAVIGELDAARALDVASQLERQGLVPVDIEEQSKHRAQLFGFKPRVSTELLIMFSRQMHALLSAGVSITSAIKGLAEANRSKLFRSVLSDLSRRLESGVELHIALQSHTDVFPELYVAMVRVGENTGHLEESFKHLATHLEREREAKRRFKQVTRYPLFLLLAIVFALGFINAWVIPGFESLFSKYQADLPFATQMLIGVSDFVLRYGVLMLASFGLLFGAFYSWLQTERGTVLFERGILRLPVVGGLLRYIALSRFAHSFSMVMQAGVPITNGLTIASGACGNKWIERCIARMRSAIERGESLYPAALISGVFTNLVLQMIAVGEESGKLDKLLEEVAQFYDDEVDYSVKTLTDVIEPVLIVAMGVMVLILALGVALPIWDLGQAAMGGR